MFVFKSSAIQINGQSNGSINRARLYFYWWNAYEYWGFKTSDVMKSFNARYKVIGNF